MTVGGKKEGESEGWKEARKEGGRRERTGRDATFHSKAAGMGIPC